MDFLSVYIKINDVRHGWVFPAKQFEKGRDKAKAALHWLVISLCTSTAIQRITVQLQAEDASQSVLDPMMSKREASILWPFSPIDRIRSLSHAQCFVSYSQAQSDDASPYKMSRTSK
jgi:hypothetical protein